MLMSAEHRDALRKLFADRLQSDVVVNLRAGVSRGDDAPTALLAEVAALSDKLALVAREDAPSEDLVPVIQLEAMEQGALLFFGVPTGYELPVFIDAIVATSRGQASLSTASISKLATLDATTTIRVYTTPT